MNLRHRLSGALHPLGMEERGRAVDIQGSVMVGGGIAERIVDTARETTTEERETGADEGEVGADQGKGREATATGGTGETVMGIGTETGTRGTRSDRDRRDRGDRHGDRDRDRDERDKKVKKEKRSRSRSRSRSRKKSKKEKKSD